MCHFNPIALRTQMLNAIGLKLAEVLECLEKMRYFMSDNIKVGPSLLF